MDMFLFGVFFWGGKKCSSIQMGEREKKLLQGINDSWFVFIRSAVCHREKPRRGRGEGYGCRRDGRGSGEG